MFERVKVEARSLPFHPDMSCMARHIRGSPFPAQVERCSAAEDFRCALHHGCKHPVHIRRCSHQRRSTRLRTHAAPKHNPQNVPDPVVMPDRSFSPEDTVATQLRALQHNDHPWPNHGIQTMYEFAQDVGGMERSIYFGPDKLKDLYHFDHFMGLFQSGFGELTGAQGFDIAPSTRTERGNVILPVTVHTRTGKALAVRSGNR